MGAQLLLERKQVGLGIHLEGQGVQGVPLLAAAAPVLPPERAEGIEVRADHEPPRTARTWLLLLLLFAFTLPLLKFTFHALFGLLALVVDDQ